MGLKTLLRIKYTLAKWQATKWKRRKQFSFENVVEPLMDEVTLAAEGNLPGAPGQRNTEWSEIGEEVRINMPDTPVRIGDHYEEMLRNLAGKEQQKQRIGSQFIDDLPGGEQRGSEFYITLGVEQMRGPTDIPQERGSKGELDGWLDSCWDAFEEASTSSELETRIRGLSREHETPFDAEAIRYWEDSAGYPNWEESFWHLYETGNLRSYHTCAKQLQEYEQESINSAKEFKNWLIKMN